MIRDIAILEDWYKSPMGGFVTSASESALISKALVNTRLRGIFKKGIFPAVKDHLDIEWDEGNEDE